MSDDKCPKCDYWYRIGKGDGYEGGSYHQAETAAEIHRLRKCLEEIEECAESYGSSWCNWYATKALQDGDG